MSALAETFFAPSNTDAIGYLIVDYQADRRDIETVDQFMKGRPMRRALSLFLEGAVHEYNRYSAPDVERIFNVEKAVKVLDSEYWNRALDLTDVMDYMPDARRQEWVKHIQEYNTPEFTEENVRATLSTLMAQRMDFLAEMVDGIFRGLSGEHVTNRPEGFSKRMIINYVYNAFGATHHKHGLIQDMRCVIAKFMKRDQPKYGVTQRMLNHIRKTTGVWHDVDGGAFKIRVYLKGTAHMEVHPDIAWRLNQILAHRYPRAIPSQYRNPPKKTTTIKTVKLTEQLIPFSVLQLLQEGRWDDRAHSLSAAYYDHADKHLKQAAGKILESIGGTWNSYKYDFDYNAEDVINEIISTGAIPDYKSHQYYPTPDRLAEIAVALADIREGYECLEPSAGQGAIARKMPGRVECVEVNKLNCMILERRLSFEASVHHADFLTWKPDQLYDRIVMNPPYSEGRWKAHVRRAAELLNPGGRLVAILPASAQGKDILPGMKIKWSDVYKNQFAKASVDVVILVADK